MNYSRFFSADSTPAIRGKANATVLSGGASVSRTGLDKMSSSELSGVTVVLLQTELDISRMAVSIESGRRKCHGSPS